MCKQLAAWPEWHCAAEKWCWNWNRNNLPSPKLFNRYYALNAIYFLRKRVLVGQRLRRYGISYFISLSNSTVRFSVWPIVNSQFGKHKYLLNDWKRCLSHLLTNRLQIKKFTRTLSLINVDAWHRSSFANNSSGRCDACCSIEKNKRREICQRVESQKNFKWKQSDKPTVLVKTQFLDLN